jgi:hypothetical protein
MAAWEKTQEWDADPTVGRVSIRSEVLNGRIENPSYALVRYLLPVASFLAYDSSVLLERRAHLCAQPRSVPQRPIVIRPIRHFEDLCDLIGRQIADGELGKREAGVWSAEAFWIGPPVANLRVVQEGGQKGEATLLAFVAAGHQSDELHPQADIAAAGYLFERLPGLP